MSHAEIDTQLTEPLSGAALKESSSGEPPLVQLMAAVLSGQFEADPQSYQALLSWTCAMVDKDRSCMILVELMGTSVSFLGLVSRTIALQSSELEQVFGKTSQDLQRKHRKLANTKGTCALSTMHLMRLMHRVNTMWEFHLEDRRSGLSPMHWLGRWICTPRSGKSVPALYIQTATGFPRLLEMFEVDAAKYPSISGYP